jgi:putative membrane protein
MTSTAMPALDRSTQLAVDRTRLAYERTMMAWIRTAASLISFGFTIYKFFQLELRGPAAVDRLIGAREFALIMIATGLVALMLAGLQHRQSLRLMKEAYGAMPRSVAGPIAALVALLGVLALAAVVARA